MLTGINLMVGKPCDIEMKESFMSMLKLGWFYNGTTLMVQVGKPVSGCCSVLLIIY